MDGRGFRESEKELNFVWRCVTYSSQMAISVVCYVPQSFVICMIFLTSYSTIAVRVFRAMLGNEAEVESTRFGQSTALLFVGRWCLLAVHAYITNSQYSMSTYSSVVRINVVLPAVENTYTNVVLRTVVYACFLPTYNKTSNRRLSRLQL